MKIRRLDIIEIEIPFRMTFRHALAERNQGHGVLVRTEDDEGRVGFGECVPRSYVTGETPASVQEALRIHLAPPFAGSTFASFDEVVQALGAAGEDLPRDQHAAFCALELSVLDLAGRAFACAAGDVCGPLAQDAVEYSGVVSADGQEASLRILELIRSHGFRHVKLKVGTNEQEDEDLLRQAREILGTDCRLRVDANCAWDADEALRRLESLAVYDLEGVEQPLPAHDVDGLAHVTARSPVPVILDESLASLDDARMLIDRRACHHFNIRISKCGGLINATRIRDLARDAGVRFQLGAQVGETVLLSAAGRHFAARSDDVLFSEGSFGTILLESDIGIQDLTLTSGRPVPIPDGPGLGVEVDELQLAPYVSSTISLGGS